MPAILEDDAWVTWLDEGNATPKAVLTTMESATWEASPEPKKPTTRKRNFVRRRLLIRSAGKPLGYE
jgi:hypothetical protein